MTSSVGALGLGSLLLLASTSLAACGGAPAVPATASPANAAADAPSKAPVADLVVAPMTLIAHFDHEAKVMNVLELRADGTIVSAGKTVAHVAGRTIVDEAGATLVGFDVEGKLVGLGKKSANVDFDADDALTASHADRTEKVGVAADGRIVVWKNGAEQQTDDVYFLSPPPTGRARRTGILLMATMSILGEKKQIDVH